MGTHPHAPLVLFLSVGALDFNPEWITRSKGGTFIFEQYKKFRVNLLKSLNFDWEVNICSLIKNVHRFRSRRFDFWDSIDDRRSFRYCGLKSNALIIEEFQWGQNEIKVERKQEIKSWMRMVGSDLRRQLSCFSFWSYCKRSSFGRWGVARRPDHYRHCPLMDIYECTNQRYHYRASMQSESII